MTILSALAFAAPAFAAPHKVARAFPAYEGERPLFITAIPGTRTLAVVEQDGQIYALSGSSKPVKVLDLGDKVRRVHNEEGLLGLAFHPDFANNGRLFIYYSASRPTRNVLSEWAWKSGAVDPASERVLLKIEKPYGNHNGGMVAFGPDGKLYFSVGDGGSAGDPHDNAQNLNSLLGKIHRIDVDKNSTGRGYSIPADNPFASNPGARPEIWAYGLRNVWRFSFDRKTGDLWAGDVGQDAYEEIDKIARGGNYGWNRREGRHVYHNGPGGPFLEPIVELPRSQSQSVTGGYVYRGKKRPKLAGAYIFGDFMSGKIWSYQESTNKLSEIAEGELISSFGENSGGELYFTSFDGKIYTLAP